VFAGVLETTVRIKVDESKHPLCEIDPLGADNFGAATFWAFAIDLLFGKIGNHRGRVQIACVYLSYPV
jgi:hypothetical protein